MPLQPRCESGRRLIVLAVALLLSALLAVPASGVALAQAPPDEDVAFVNEDEEPVERKKDGRFVARPLLDREIANLYYGVRDADTGDWITEMFRVRADGKRRSDGWEYSWEYPFEDGQPGLDPESAYLLVVLVEDADDGRFHTLHAVIPVHRPGGLWDRVLGALDPSRWARAAARWVVEGVHGTLCGVVEEASGEDADECREGSP